jgi:hypothetical protein
MRNQIERRRIDYLDRFPLVFSIELVFDTSRLEPLVPNTTWRKCREHSQADNQKNMSLGGLWVYIGEYAQPGDIISFVLALAIRRKITQDDIMKRSKRARGATNIKRGGAEEDLSEKYYFKKFQVSSQWRSLYHKGTMNISHSKRHLYAACRYVIYSFLRPSLDSKTAFDKS